jgi:hypothetical protein
MPPIRLTDAQLDVIMAAAESLAVADRDPFLRDVAERLRGLPNCSSSPSAAN